jgi:large subunit ribosomal protein L33
LHAQRAKNGRPPPPSGDQNGQTGLARKTAPGDRPPRRDTIRALRARSKPAAEPGSSPPMGKSKKKVETVFLVCEETGDYNYTLRRKPGGEKLKLKKYSPRLRKHTIHTEKKK